MPLQRSEYSCPICKESNIKSQICANAGELVCDVNPAHKWQDTASFYALGPVMEYKVAPAQFPPQQGHEPIQIPVPIGLKQALETKFGGNLAATVASVLRDLVDGEVMIVGEIDLNRMGEKLGSRPRNSSELYGMIYAKMEEIAEQKMIAEAAKNDLKAYEGVMVGRVVVDLAEQFGEAAARAKDAALPLALWCSRALQGGIKDNWF